MGAKCLVKIYIGQSAFKVLNPTKQEIQLQKGKVLACASDVDSSAVYSFDEFTTSSVHNTAQVNMIKSTSKHCKCQYTFKNSKHTTKTYIWSRQLRPQCPTKATINTISAQEQRHFCFLVS